jgi:amino acid transporter
MKKNIIIYGLIAGIVVSILMLSTVNYISHCEGNVDYNTSMLIGYASMFIALSLVFVGIRNYRDKYNEGVISFGKAFKIGVMMVLIASTIYVVAWLIDYFFFIPDFMEKYSAHMLDELKASGASQIEIDKQAKKMADFARMYKNPFFNAMMTYVEILPVGLVVTLISSLILKRTSLPAAGRS